MTAYHTDSTSLSDELFALIQKLSPKHLLSRGMYALMRQRHRGLRNLSINTFLRFYQVNMAEAQQSDPLAYDSFNAFFTRALKPDARPIDTDSHSIVSPVDGTVSQCGLIDGDHLIQAKGHHYSLLALLGGDTKLAKRYQGGHFACIYLAPYNYHRIHMPMTGSVHDTVYVPGELFSVNAATARSVPGLFARNERVICNFSTASSAQFAMVFVGALFVGSIETIWNGEINPPPRRTGPIVRLPQGIGSTFEKGAEAGRFNMGSTVILLFEPNQIQWNTDIQSGAVVHMGEVIARTNPSVNDTTVHE